MMRRMIDAARLRWRRSVDEELARQADARSRVRIGRTLGGTLFEILVALLNVVLWALAIHFRDRDTMVWIAAAGATFVSFVFCNIAYDPGIISSDLPESKRLPSHFLLAVWYNRLAALFSVLIGISTELSFLEGFDFTLSMILLVAGSAGFLVFRLLLCLK